MRCGGGPDFHPAHEACGVDLRHNENVVWNNTEYSTTLFTKKAIDIVKNHDKHKVSEGHCVNAAVEIRRVDSRFFLETGIFSFDELERAGTTPMGYGRAKYSAYGAMYGAFSWRNFCVHIVYFINIIYQLLRHE